MMAMLHHCSVPLARVVVRPSPRTRAAISFATSSSPTPTPPSQVLLGLSESDLQKLAIDFGQQGFRGKQLYHLIYKRKVRDIQEFVQVPLAFRNELEEAGWKVGRSPIFNKVVATDGTIKGVFSAQVLLATRSHVAEMIVRETLQFAGRCQGVGFKYDMLMELTRREKNAGIKPNEGLDLFMKSLALNRQETILWLST